MNMTKEKAMEIAEDFLEKMNPDMWDGYGVKPPSFDDMIYEYPLTDEVRLEIVFIYDEEDGWHYCCDLVYRTSNESIFESIILEKEEYGEFEWKLLEKLFTESKEVSIIKLNMTSVETFAE